MFLNEDRIRLLRIVLEKKKKKVELFEKGFQLYAAFQLYY